MAIDRNLPAASKGAQLCLDLDTSAALWSCTFLPDKGRGKTGSGAGTRPVSFGYSSLSLVFTFIGGGASTGVDFLENSGSLIG